ncbi:777_t:CDS:2 [Dentiscutata erythropus]|uniref:777_t:CDS:1 n=1 Tax=Dentiscutata erythropus TaxID=1348616 RepID=A0A9N9H2C8_9GLOM|nr:777_t:CDS:2 [Dentiscutata erythropus]
MHQLVIPISEINPRNSLMQKLGSVSSINKMAVQRRMLNKQKHLAKVRFVF